MRHSLVAKFIAFVLCAASLVAIAGGAVGLGLTEHYGLYSASAERLQQDKRAEIADALAWYYAESYAADRFSNCPWEILSDMYSCNYIYVLAGRYGVEVYEDGGLVESAGDPELENAQQIKLQITPSYPVMTSQYTLDEDGNKIEESINEDENAEIQPESEEATITAESARAESEETTIATEPAQTDVARFRAEQDEMEILLYSDSTYYMDWETRQRIVYNLNYYQGPGYDVIVYLDAGERLLPEFGLYRLLEANKEAYLPALLVGLLSFIASLVFLLAAAGNCADGEIRPGGLNKVPLDLYFTVCLGAAAVMLIPILFVVEGFEGYNELYNSMDLCLIILGLSALGAASCAIAFFFALAAQVKVKDGYWWRHSVCGWFLQKIGGALRSLKRGVTAVFRMLPAMWQWLLSAAALLGADALFLFLFCVTHGGTQEISLLLFFLFALATLAAVCYVGWCFSVLLKGAKAMVQGDLNCQVPTNYLVGPFRAFATQLNSLAGAAQAAAAKQMKSERMKTELITNVSHDIKTPLTSIINFVDLLKKPHSEAQAVQYLDVLDRQSQRLKKLIDDLMEMSKASTGNLTVELGQVDAAEAINQALGEFSDKLDAAHLTPVFRYPDTPVTMMADGRLVWRVLSNLLSNAVKYALPDTRLYLDLMVLQGNAVIAIKNISRDQLNVNAEELMERFVRGDTSRNTEGSGLGLNIAKSLVELQKGQMHLMVDGDLFKVTLIFPLA